MWTLRYSKADEAYLQAKGAAALNDKTNPENLWAWTAFQSLRGSRAMGMSAGAIPISEIVAYCDLVGIVDATQRQRLARFVMHLDAAERKHHGDTPFKH